MSNLTERTRSIVLANNCSSLTSVTLAANSLVNDHSRLIGRWRFWLHTAQQGAHLLRQARPGLQVKNIGRSAARARNSLAKPASCHGRAFQRSQVSVQQLCEYCRYSIGASRRTLACELANAHYFPARWLGCCALELATRKLSDNSIGSASNNN